MVHLAAFCNRVSGGAAAPRQVEAVRIRDRRRGQRPHAGCKNAWKSIFSTKNRCVQFSFCNNMIILEATPFYRFYQIGKVKPIFINEGRSLKKNKSRKGALYFADAVIVLARRWHEQASSDCGDCADCERREWDGQRGRGEREKEGDGGGTPQKEKAPQSHVQVRWKWNIRCLKYFLEGNQ